MKRFSKVCGSIVLAASLVVGSLSYTPAQAATSEADLTEFATLIATAKTATAQIATTNITTSTLNADVSVSFSGIPIASIPVKDLATTVDPFTKKAKMTGSVTIPDLSGIAALSAPLASLLEKYDIKAGVRDIQDYGDLEKKVLYRYNSKVGRAEMAALPETLQGTSIIDKIDATKLAKLAPYLTITKGKSGDVTLNLKADEAGIKSTEDEVKSLVKSIIADSEYSSLISGLKKNVQLTGIDLTIKLYVDATTGALSKHDVDAKIDFTYSGNPLSVAIKSSTVSTVTTDSVAIPEAFTKGAQLIANYPLTKNGVNLVSTLSGKKTVFSVSSVKNKKTITIPASVKVLGTSYKVTKAAKNAFKKAAKLKTLKVKNSTLKKALKKNRSKYGLSKKVKIK